MVVVVVVVAAAAVVSAFSKVSRGVLASAVIAVEKN